MQKRNDKRQGFTIIEVVLVLAIAGLIFLIVFLALPALQRSQRDTQRKNDLSRFMSQVTAYQSNSQGKLPADQTAWTSFVGNYLTNGGQSFADPQTGSYTVTMQASNSTAVSAAGQLYVYPGYKCDSAGTNGLSANTGSRNFAAVIFQEQGGYYCQSN